jgi:hypothetical protein
MLLLVLGSLGNRMRLVLRQPDAELGFDASAAGLPEVDFVAYGPRERLSGRIRLDAARLTDMLNSHDEILLVDALAERLPDGGTMVVPEVLVRRSELAVVHVAGPRGDRSQRIPTETHRIALLAGRYHVRGRIHAGRGQDPLASLRTRAMVPLTDAEIRFRVAGVVEMEPATTVIVNRDLVSWVRPDDGADPDHEVP